MNTYIFHKDGRVTVNGQDLVTHERNRLVNTFQPANFTEYCDWLRARVADKTICEHILKQPFHFYTHVANDYGDHHPVETEYDVGDEYPEVAEFFRQALEADEKWARVAQRLRHWVSLYNEFFPGKWVVELLPATQSELHLLKEICEHILSQTKNG